MREKYESLSLAALRELAKARGLRGISALRKPQLVERMLQEDEKEAAMPQTEKTDLPGAGEKEEPVSQEAEKAEKISRPGEGERPAPSRSPERKVIRRYNRPSENRPIRENSHYSENRSYRQNERTVREVSRAQERVEHPGNRADRTERPVERTDRAQERVEHPGNRADRTERPVERTDRAQERVEHPGNRADRSERPVERIDRAQERPERVPGHGENPQVSASENPGSMTAEQVSGMYNVPAETVQLDSGEKANGILEVLQDGYGFIRSDNYMPGSNDIYVSPSQIRRFNLKTGDLVQGNIRIKTQGEKFSALLYVTSINGFHPSEGQKRYNFENMTPIFPNERLVLERPGGTMAMRIVDLISPIGKGQRGMIVSPPKAGKTTLLKDVAKSILTNNPGMHLIILLIDERPEEVTDIREAIQGPNVEAIYSTFDELPDHHRRVSEMAVEHARRLVEHRKDVIILLDSITRLARACNLTVAPSGRTLSGGLDPGALNMPKRFFGAARNMREGGSLTILATALVDTGSKMDDVVYEEFKGTGNMELILDRKLQERRVFPAIDIQKSGTRREDLLLDREEQEAVYIMRRALNGMKSEDAVEQILNMFSRTRNNAEFVQMVKKQKFL
ncbi:MAG: transcription termination factor Rho [Clostridiales bacterium]|nr:transcription termination factor Rho [Clostridiales bacterium]